MKHGKKYNDSAKLIETGKFYDVDEAVAVAVKTGTAKFDETVECHMRLGIEVKHADQQVRSTTVIPAGLGKTVRGCVIAKADKAALAKEAGADEAGAEDVIEKIAGGWFEFDTLIATPDMMAP